MGFFDAFFGTVQSQYAAYAIVAAIVAICITILLTGTDVPIGNRFLIVFFVIISLIPSIFLMLFELTCIVTGGTSTERWWCWLFAWIIAVFIIIYCIFIVIISFISLFTYNNAINKVKISDNENKMTPQNSNNYAKTIIESNKQVEKFISDNQIKSNIINEAYENLVSANNDNNIGVSGQEYAPQQNEVKEMSYPAPYDSPPPEQPKPIPPQNSPPAVIPVPPENRAPKNNTDEPVSISNFSNYSSLSSLNKREQEGFYDFNENFGNLETMSSMYAPF